MRRLPGARGRAAAADRSRPWLGSGPRCRADSVRRNAGGRRSRRLGIRSRGCPMSSTPRRSTGPSDTTRRAAWEKCSPPTRRSWTARWPSSGSGPTSSTTTARRRFLREAAITARLQHPGIVPIYGLGQDEDGPFYTMPFIEGQTLQEAIDAFHGDESLPAATPAGGASSSAGCSSTSSRSATRWPMPTTRGSCTAT